MKKLKRANSLFLLCEISSAVLKTWITNEPKTQITQIFQILYPIQGGYYVKAYVPRIPKMWYFLCLAVLKVELLAPEVRSKFKKKDTATILIFEAFPSIFFLIFDPTSTANNSTSKTARPKKYHIFGILGT